MRLQHLMFIGALAAVPAVMAVSTPAQAIRVCTCSDITFPGGVCTQYDHCTELKEVVGTRALSATKTCRHSQTLVCDENDNSCKVVCAPKQKQSADPNSKS